MRNQDVALMKQLININDTIQNMSGKRSIYRRRTRNTCKRNSSLCVMPTYAMKTLKVKPMTQSISVPCCAQLNNDLSGSLSSIDGENLHHTFLIILC